MLLPDNIHPENCIYYNSALVLKILQQTKSIDLLELYGEVKQIKNIAFPVFILCLDWLYLINIAEVKAGRIELCS
jgi:hypothetical protein